MIFNKKCNIDTTDRINRIVIGIIILIAALLKVSTMFYVVAAIVLIIEGVVGICYIPKLVQRIKDLKKRKG